MVVDGAGGVGPADSRTGVATLVADAGQVGGALRVDGALVSTLHIGVTLEAGKTGTGGRSISLPTLCIDATRTWSAGINDFWSWCSCGRSVAGGKGISNKALITDTNWNMVSHIAVCINSTKARARVLTSSVDTGLIS